MYACTCVHVCVGNDGINGTDGAPGVNGVDGVDGKSLESGSLSSCSLTMSCLFYLTCNVVNLPSHACV